MRNRLIGSLAVVVLSMVAVGIPPALATPGDQLDRALDRAVVGTKAPGATAALVENGDLVWSGAAGERDVDTGAAMEPADLFSIASTTKTVTAAMVMDMVAAGEIGLEQTIEGVLPGLPDSDEITVRMLLDHSSGLVDYFADGEIGRIIARDPFHAWTREEILAHVPRTKFEPGSRHSYSNSNFIALGSIVVAGGTSVERRFEDEIAAPLGLADAGFAYDDALLPRLAHPHSGGGRRPFRDLLGDGDAIGTDYWGPVWTDGGLVASAPELARFGNALFAGELLPVGFAESMAPSRIRGWGLGTFALRSGGRRWVGHDGLYGGYTTENWTDVKRGVTVVVFANAHGYERGRSAAATIWQRLARATRDR